MSYIIRKITPTNLASPPGNLILTTILLFLMLISFGTARAELASYEEMQNVAQNWLTYIIAETGDWAGETDPYIIEVQDIVVNDTLLARYYAISSSGYIIVPALMELPPVKAYTEEYPLDINETDGFALLLREVLQDRTRIFVDVYGSLEASQPTDKEPLFDFKNREKWNLLTVSPSEFANSADKNLMAPVEGAGPLLTTAWHQRSPYNDLCPMGDGGRCVVGCVATAAAQIIYYHQWPPAGEGSHSYTWSGDQSCGGSTPAQVLTADFSDPYIYDGSPASVAEISYEMGVAFEMNYGACASGAWTLYGSEVFPAYFRYDQNTQRKYRNQHTSTSWFELIKNDINKGRPILYRISGHAIVCDGWRVAGSLDQYHFNYGWGGSQNTWYTVDNLYCNWSGCDPMVEQMVVNIIPLNGSPWLSGSEFTDDLGDGDGIPESGETVEMSITVANFGGAAIDDVTLELAIDDASINITDGSAYIGTINPNDSVSNVTDPFSFDIPIDYISRIDSFMVQISWNAGTKVDTIVIEKAIGNVSILLVDDDENGEINEYYEESLSDYRIPFDVWEHAAYSTPDAAYLSNYDIVIWFTGDYRTYPMSLPEIEAMSGYLDNGGKLFLSGQRIAAQLSTFNPSFLNNYLKSDYFASQYIPVMDTEDGQVFDSGFRVAIQGGNSASNQEYPDLVTPTAGGIAELKYLGSDYYGAVSYSGDYQSVFFTFGFEAVVSDDNRWRGRAEVMNDILNFFAYPKPGPCPMASDISVSPGDPMHMLDHTPEITWLYFDEQSAPQSHYQIQVGSDANWFDAEMWDSGPVAGDMTQMTYAGSELQDGDSYYVRVRVSNGTLWSDWAEGELRMNSVPSPAADLSPSDMTGVTSDNPTLSHTNAVDAENDQLVYAYEVYADPELSMLLDQVSGHPSGAGSTSWTVTVPLDDNSVYYWRVRGDDPYEEGLWTDAVSFWVNSVNDIPASFSLLSPTDGEKIPGRTVNFTWEASSDADPYDQIEYTLYYSTDPSFASKTVISELDSTSYAPTVYLEYGTTYYWRVIAQDMFSGQTNCQSDFSFTTISRGDANGDGFINVADAVFIINYIFNDGPPPDPIESGDANCDTGANVGDAVYLISYIFNGGPEPGCH